MNSLSYCVKEKRRCIGWAQRYFGDCLCNLKDELSFGFGLISLVCWGLAEIPQIVTNFRAKSGHGISLAFLLTWVVGDIFNLVGCLLEPATLPTQLYTAVLYTATTVILVLQSIYYDYYKRLRHGQQKDSNYQEDDIKKPLRPSQPNDSAIPIPNGTRRTEAYYYTSARSLAGSMTPPIRSYLWPIKSGPSALGLENDSSSDDEVNPSPSPSPNTILATQTASRPKPISRSAGYGAFFATSMNLPRESNALVYIGLTGRKLLQEQGTETVYGQLLGWMMATVYMGGRLPQIWLNGLNPFMFIFALVANATYVASILVRSIAWDKIRANMPWLLDAVGCVILDLFIILQYVYYRYFHKENRGIKEGRACNKR
ncbi:PQ-loop repeat family protein / transmembrane family protein [Striga hermonthica]|uniref:PQ-loop repeat family protein / transmembrane family protein n=1 Tax=Striga hermonthica TaxID=68872 RepID=A0A9N7NQJ8_STRHE|nr:PQ-loop repeat family protein / transmembrane family protein [Striga hermonthica]